jgi:uncharacterized membrane protein YeaQ/YmgE (transglycosylase-associated protein family)
MDKKRITWLLATIGSYAGSYIPLLWGVSGFTISSLIFGALGAVFGIWIAFTITRNL